MVNNVLASSSVTPGSTPPNSVISSQAMPKVPVNVNSSSAMFSSSRIPSPTRTSSTRTTTPSGRPLVSTTVMMTAAHPVVLLQSSINAAVATTPRGIGLACTTTSAVAKLTTHPVLSSAPTISAKLITSQPLSL